jgi:hypothetical protein
LKVERAGQHGSYRIHEVHEPSDFHDNTAAHRVAGYVITDLENHCLSKMFIDFHAAMKEIKNLR